MLILTRGIPASGKSTWAKAWVAEDPDNRLRVNRDNLRWTLGIKQGIGTFPEEEEVTYWQRQMVQRAIEQGKDVVIDDTNIRAKYAKDWLMLARAYGVPVEFKDFPIPMETALFRDAMRGSRGERSVGYEVIEDFYKRYTPKGALPPVPVLPEDETPKFKYQPYTFTPGLLSHAIIVDIDGTLAHMDGRSPYDPTLYHTDKFDYVVARVAQAYADQESALIILLSGRDEQYADETRAWLDKYREDFGYDRLYMRPIGDTRNDAIVKNELFEKYIAGKYNVDFVLDDRNRVVDMWRAKGLKVLQVADGNF